MEEYVISKEDFINIFNGNEIISKKDYLEYLTSTVTSTETIFNKL